jgi:enoyl-CoA hydratase
MKHLLTGDPFDAAEAHRMGLVQEVVRPGTQRDRATELAERIATAAAPLSVAATLRSAYRATYESPRRRGRPTPADAVPLFASEDGAGACAPSSSAAQQDSSAAELHNT